MAAFEDAIKEAIRSQDIPGCALVASNRDGSFHYAKSSGKASLKEGYERPLGLDTIMWTASCTKLMTSLCCLQLVERGLASLDEPVYNHIPELENFNILSGFDSDGAPVEVKHTKPMTLRLLLTHSSGLTYDVMHPKAAAWMQYHKRPMGASGKLLQRFSAPLMFEPGESWIYGASIDYAGLLVERITGKTLEAYMKANIWEPLGIKDMTFHLSTRPDMKERMAHMSLRDPVTGKLKHTDTVIPWLDSEGKEYADCLGGQGVFTSAEEYLKLLHALLVCEENEKLLKKQTLETFFAPQLGEASSKALNTMLQDDTVNNAMGGIPKSVKKDWGLGGVLLTSDSPDGMKAGTMVWGGAPNLIWWCDRKTGLCGLYAGQVWPPGDAKVAAVNRKFEKGIYEMLAKQGNNQDARL